MSTTDKITLTDARNLVPGRPDVATLWRWAMKGVGGVKLETERWGRRLFTTEQWLNEFQTTLRERACCAPAAASSQSPRQPRPRTSTRREQQIAAAEKRLESAGFAR